MSELESNSQVKTQAFESVAVFRYAEFILILPDIVIEEI